MLALRECAASRRVVGGLVASAPSGAAVGASAAAFGACVWAGGRVVFCLITVIMRHDWPPVNPPIPRVLRGVVHCGGSLCVRPRPAMSRKRASPYTTRITIALPPALDAALRAGSDKYDVAVAVLARGAIERGVKLELDARRKQARHKPRQSARQPAPPPNPLTRADIAHIKDDDDVLFSNW